MKERPTLVADELDDEPRPRRVVVLIDVELRRDLLHAPNATPRHGRQVVMLVVIPRVEREQIADAIITVRVLTSAHERMFLDRHRVERMETEREHERQEKVRDDFPAKK